MTTAATPEELAASGKIIDILVVIDTDYIKNNNPRNTNSNSPAVIRSPTPGYKPQFLLSTGADSVQGQGTANLTFGAQPGDYVNFRGTSIYANSDDAVIIYGIQNLSGAVFHNFSHRTITREKAVVPNDGMTNGIPAITRNINFAAYNAQILHSGTENFVIQFGLYEYDRKSASQVLYGYFKWDPVITVRG